MYVVLGSRVVASTSSAHSASLHTTAVLQAQVRKAKSRASGKANGERRREAQEKSLASRPHIVLGHNPGDETKWPTCDLAKILVSADEVASPNPLPTDPKTANDLVEPKYYNFGIGEQEKHLLFTTLPALTQEGAMESQRSRIRGDPQQIVIVNRETESVENRKKALLTRLVDLGNANARGIAYENRRRIVTEFSTPEKPADTGRPEVQGMSILFHY